MFDRRLSTHHTTVSPVAVESKSCFCPVCPARLLHKGPLIQCPLSSLMSVFLSSLLSPCLFSILHPPFVRQSMSVRPR